MDSADAVMDDGPGDLPDQAFNTLPPGDEGFDISHAGGEHEVFKGVADELGMYAFTFFCFVNSFTH